MIKYVKQKDYKVIETAPKTKGSISNYNSLQNGKMLIEDGYILAETEYAYNGDEYIKGHCPLQPIEELRSLKIEEIKQGFTDEIEVSGTLVSSIDGFVIDARRVDVMNIQGLIDTYSGPTLFMGKSGIRANTTLEELNTFKQELIRRGQELYYKKWQKEEEIKVATHDNINDIKWED